MNNSNETIADDAVFCFDMIIAGYSLNVSADKIYLCRYDGREWQNSLVSSIIHFPKSEILDEIIGCVYTRIWFSDEDWLPLNIQPNVFGINAFQLVKSMLQICRDLNDRQINQLIDSCTSLTYKQAWQILGQ